MEHPLASCPYGDLLKYLLLLAYRGVQSSHVHFMVGRCWSKWRCCSIDETRPRPPISCARFPRVLAPKLNRCVLREPLPSTTA